MDSYYPYSLHCTSVYLGHSGRCNVAGINEINDPNPPTAIKKLDSTARQWNDPNLSVGWVRCGDRNHGSMVFLLFVDICNGDVLRRRCSDRHLGNPCVGQVVEMRPPTKCHRSTSPCFPTSSICPLDFVIGTVYSSLLLSSMRRGLGQRVIF